MFWFPRPVPLRLVFIAPFVVQIFLAVGITGWLSYQQGQRAVDEVAEELSIQAKYRVRERLDAIVDRAEILTQTNTYAYQQGQISLDRELALQEHFWQQMNFNQPAPQGIYVGDPLGRYVYVGFQDRTLVAETSQSQQLTIYLLNSQGQRQQPIGKRRYDPRDRLWYKDAIEENKPVWTQIYDFASGETGITLAQTARDRNGKVLAIAAIDLGLDELDKYLRSIKLSDSSQIFIVERSGLLVATSSDSSFVEVPNRAQKFKRISASESKISSVRESANYLLQEYGSFDRINESLKLKTQWQEKNYYISVLPYEFGKNQKWLVVTVVPERDFNKQIEDNERTTLLLCVLSLFLAIAVGNLTSGMLAKTILRLVKATDELAQGQWNQQVIPNSGSYEIDTLVNSFDRMVDRLQESFKKLETQAYINPLTGLPNRAAFLVHLQTMMAMTKEPDSSFFAVVSIDLDSFKLIENGLGQATSELLLKKIPLRLKECLESHCAKIVTIAHIDLDEFAVIFDRITDERTVTTIAQHIIESLRQPFHLGQQNVVISASIGVAIDRGDFEAPEEILRALNIAKLNAKSEGKARYAVFDKLMRVNAAEGLQIAADLQYAIERNEFELWYQPILTIEPARIVSFEALLRWKHPSNNSISPAKFIPIAEETGIIVDIGIWLLQAACCQMRTWQQEHPAFERALVSVNVSAQQLLVLDFAHRVEMALQVSGLEGRYLQLEITESAAVSQPETIIPKLSRLREMGIKICVDDFGTGYSHLSYLLQLPIDILKIDRSFVQDIGVTPKSEQIVQTILTLSHSLGLEAIAEGVETIDQLNSLQSLGCQKFQGYLFSAPLPVKTVSAELALNFSNQYLNFKESSAGKRQAK